MKLTILINIEITVVLKQHKESVNAKKNSNTFQIETKVD